MKKSSSNSVLQSENADHSLLTRILRSVPDRRTLAVVALRIFLGLVFLYAGYVKLRQPWYVFAGMIDNYGVVAPSVSEWTARILPTVEMALGLVLLTGLYRRTASAAAVALLLPFFALMLWAYLKGMEIDCGCFGPGETLGPKTLFRDGVLLAAAIYLGLLSRRSSGAAHSRRGVSETAQHSCAHN